VGEWLLPLKVARVRGFCWRLVLAAAGVAVAAVGLKPQLSEALGAALGLAIPWTPDRLHRLALVFWAYGGVLLWLAVAGARRPPMVAPAEESASQAGRVPKDCEGHLGVFLFVVTLVVAAVVRFRFLGAPLDYDEAYSFLNYALRASLLETVADYRSTNNHLLNSIAMRLCFQLFGPQEWSLRLLAFVSGMALIVVAYDWARQLFGQRGGLVAAALCAWSPALIEYSTNARGYSVVALCTLFCARTFLRVIVNPSCSKFWWMASAAVVMGFWAAPIMIIPAVSLVAWTGLWLWRHCNWAGRVRWIRWLASWALVTGAWGALLYVPGFVATQWEALQNPFVRALLLEAWAGRFLGSYVEGSVVGVQELPMDGIAARLSGKPLEALGMWLRLPSSRVALGVFALVVGTYARCWRAGWGGRQPVFVALGTLVFFAVTRLAPPPRVYLFLVPVNFAACAIWFSGDRLSQKGAGLPGRAAVQWFPWAVVACWLAAAWIAVTRAVPYRPDVQVWRLDVPEAVEALVKQNVERPYVVVALPADLPWRFYAWRTGLGYEWGLPPAGAGGSAYALVPRDAELPAFFAEDLVLRLYAEPASVWEWHPERKFRVLAWWRARQRAVLSPGPGPRPLDWEATGSKEGSTRSRLSASSQ
jgi:hypothetical protein